MRLFVYAAFVLLLPPLAEGSTWVAAVDRYSQPSNPSNGAFMGLFSPGAQWINAAKHVQVFKVSTQFLHRATDTELMAVIQGLHARGLSLAMEGLMLVSSERCGRGVEGYDGPGSISAIAERVKRLGGTIEFVAMDEPLWYGHRVNRPNACRDSIEGVAQDVAPAVKLLKAAFPGVKFGDVEPLDQQTPDWIDTILRFGTAFRSATGEPMTFLHADINWGLEWKPSLAMWRTKLHAAGMRLGVIVNGDPSDRSDQAWVTHAIERYRSVTTNSATKPDDVILQSWMVRPTQLLPDSTPGTLMNAATQINN